MMTQADDLRIAAFLSDRTEVFHSIQHRHDVWKEDPFDVETVHQEARAVFERMLLRATTPPRPESGRILLLLGDSGCGKTHLLRAFRALAHERSNGFVGYMQMTTASSNYGRYVLANLIDSLDQPYWDATEPRSGLEKISDALLAHCGDVARLLAEPEQDPAEVPSLVEFAADDLKKKPHFQKLDLDLVRALLFLQRDDTRIKSRVLKYLRCEDLSESDRAVLGGLVPRTHDHHPQEMVEHLGRLVASLEQSLVLCVDQLEGFNDFETTSVPHFRRAMTTLCDLADRVPSCVIVVSCLHNFWNGLSNQLTQPLRDRILMDPPPVKLTDLRTADEARRIAERRLEHLYAQEDAPFDPAEPTFPFPFEGFEKLAGMRARDVLNACRLWREQAIREGALPAHFPIEEGGGVKREQDTPKPPDTLALEQLWNDFRSGAGKPAPDEDVALAELLQWALPACMDELEPGHRVDVQREEDVLLVAVSPGEQKLRVTLCNRGTGRGALLKQLEQARKEARGRTPVVVRASAFPRDPRSDTAVELGKLISKGGRRAVLEDSDGRTLLALREFRQRHESRPDFAAWLRSARPLTQLKPLRDILALDTLRPQLTAQPVPDAPAVTRAPVVERPVASGPRFTQPAAFAETVVRLDSGPRAPPTQGSLFGSGAPPVSARAAAPTQAAVALKPEPAPAAPPRERGPVRIGELDSLAKSPIVLQPDELTRHAAFLGGSGSGKTTLALNVVEQLLLQGIPAILIDRKGDLAGYAAESFGQGGDGELAERQVRLRDLLDVALFTPGHPQGRPLAIPIVPDGLFQLPDFERQQATRHAADALAGMLDYRASTKDKQCRTLLAQAIDQYVQLTQQPVTLDRLISFIDDKDPRLVNAAGRLDTRLFEKLAQDLERLRLDAAALMGDGAEKLDMDLLLGRGAHASPGRTRLSIISTRFLGDTSNVLFWVSQLLIEATRWLNRSPSPTLQAVLLFDEADMYLPATRQPATKQPMENLLRRARSAGLGMLLATQSPGDFDYKCRDTIRSWFIGRIKEKTSLDKMKPMLSEARVDFTAKIPNQGTGEFHLVREGRVERLKASRSCLATEQLPDDELLRLAARTRPGR
jgi:energy-coupling factor transporter ATP-binding protein EcfA2